MKKRIERTLLNWRWWLVLPLAILVFGVSGLFWMNALLWDCAHRASWSTARDIDKLFGHVFRPILEWAREDWK